METSENLTSSTTGIEVCSKDIPELTPVITLSIPRLQSPVFGRHSRRVTKKALKQAFGENAIKALESAPIELTP